MISDVLSEAVRKVDLYLSDPAFAQCYTGELRRKIEKLRFEMDAVREYLDTPPKRNPDGDGFAAGSDRQRAEH
jgi:hypothetical protein